MLNKSHFFFVTQYETMHFSCIRNVMILHWSNNYILSNYSVYFDSHIIINIIRIVFQNWNKSNWKLLDSLKRCSQHVFLPKLTWSLTHISLCILRIMGCKGFAKEYLLHVPYIWQLGARYFRTRENISRLIIN